jgi:hypothetical protein
VATSSGPAAGVFAQSAGGPAVIGLTSSTTAAIFGLNSGSDSSAQGIYGRASSGIGVQGESASSKPGVYGLSTASGQGVLGDSRSGDGVDGTSAAGGRSGVYGVNSATGGYGVYGRSTDAGGVAVAGSGDNGGKAAHFYAGDVYIDNNLHVTKQIFAGTKDFKIDHPLDPANEYLVHASIESSEMLNIYTGNATLDGHGAATVALPAWMEAENSDFRYQLTAVGSSQPGLYVAQEIRDHRFVVAGGAPGGKVSWQISGVRRDRWALANPLVVEEKKPAKERGLYLHPDAYGLSSEKRIGWSEDPHNPDRKAWAPR